MTSSSAAHVPTRIGWIALRFVLLLEVIGGAWLLINVAQGVFAAQGEPLGDLVILLLATALWWAWIAITAWGAWRGRPGWVRGSSITIHVLLFAAATGILQGLLGPQTVLGLEVLVLALAGFVAALLARPDAPVVPGE
ncbi:hypothetical protein [Leucobacter luti]|uniref:DUF2568 domain-containing protein n=1 Tax=Leucobacter luti TaxID=340320 RepID=A0A4Q7TWC9_9MICO|nr:hypothetical protein [Leucobacter luti]MBL3698392.1 hypothetical protein [Leucobacter luti]RZT64520.1 hypothetical protein EV139_1938 [Leucobacter luti]